MSYEKRRPKYDIYADIIEAISKKGSCTLTRVSYGANMPGDRTKKEVRFLISLGFVTEAVVDASKKYKVTKWGLEYLETCKQMRKSFAALDEK